MLPTDWRMPHCGIAQSLKTRRNRPVFWFMLHEKPKVKEPIATQKIATTLKDSESAMCASVVSIRPKTAGFWAGEAERRQLDGKVGGA